MKSHNMETLLLNRLLTYILTYSLYPVDNAIDFPHTYPLDMSNLSGRYYPTFEQPRSQG